MKKVYIFATVMALLTALSVYLFASSLEKNMHIQDAPSSVVLTVTVDLPENTVLTQDMLEQKKLPDMAITKGTAKSIEEAVGKITKYPLSAGEQVILSKLGSIGEEGSGKLSLELPKGYRAVTISVDDVIGVAGFINKGDYVDVISTMSKESVVTTSLLLQKVKVIRVGSSSPAGQPPSAKYETVTLSLTPDDAVKLSYAATNGVIRLTLRPLLDN